MSFVKNNITYIIDKEPKPIGLYRNNADTYYEPVCSYILSATTKTQTFCTTFYMIRCKSLYSSGFDWITVSNDIGSRILADYISSLVI